MDQTLILDISSDEEVGFDDSSTADNFDWISKLLEEVGGDNCDISGGVLDDDGAGNGGKDDDDSDDVVVVGEVIVKPKKAKISMPRYDFDDDCVVLNCDPDKSVAEVKGSSDDSDDLLIVGEKGQVACRDYPHSRHLCAKFPFSSTSHESHCNLCHCYVCDSLAPCAYWGSGILTSDHCHATDKEEHWQLERKKVRLSKNPSLPITKPTAPLANIARVQQPSPRPNQGPVPSSFGLPNIISQGRSSRNRIGVARSRFTPHLVSQQLLRACHSNNAQNNVSSNLAHCSVPSCPLFKRPGFTVRSRLPNRSAYCPPNNVSVAYLPQPWNHHLAGKPIEDRSITPNLGSSQPNSSGISMVTLPSQLRGYTHPSTHMLTSHFQGPSQCTALTSDSSYIYTPGNQTQSVCSPTLPMNIVRPSNQQASTVTQNGSSPLFPSCTRQSSQRPSAVTPVITSTSSPCGTFDGLIGDAQSRQRPSAENFEVEGAVPTRETLPSMEENPLAFGNASSGGPDFDLDSWLSDNDSVLGVQEGESYLLGLNSQPPPYGPLDTGMLNIDFDTSWKHLANSLM